MSDNPLSGKVTLDTTDYKSGAAELSRQIRVIESGFRAAAAGMQAWDKDANGLEKRIQSLTTKIGLQQQKVDGLSRVYKELAAGGKTSAKELEELQIRINNETESLNKMQGELTQSETALKNFGKEGKDAGKDTDNLRKNEDKATTSTNRFKCAMAGLGSAL